ncbi:GNAT family N-acetyltransferase [Persicirhabdus sediminis]|uniref:GNAT family N-acetyltransferase n=1 Tax=Persicirhabdus sediminis TaxID=454144 RepID=A0A8J7MBC0_9BACT|nr:GNAT family N-acetyltransferase [Persicirhabdus sediminis]MBK1790292.1 GNAT family N-acetyltransferase [Persicirhabdus sediminis]
MKCLQPEMWKDIVLPGNRVFFGSGAAVPHALIDSMLTQAQFYKDVVISHTYTLGQIPWVDVKYAGAMRAHTFFLTAEMGAALRAGRADYTPCPFSDIPRLFSERLVPIDVALIQCSPPDADGYVSLGVSVDVVKAAVKSARRVVAQINPKMPVTGGDSKISIERIDYYLEAEADLPELFFPLECDAQAKAAEYAAHLVDDGATIQAGLSAGSQAVLGELRNHKHLGIYTGIFTDGMMDLVKCGAVDNSMKGIHDGVCVTNQVIGSRKLYEFANKNDLLEMRTSDWLGDPWRIAQNERMVAIYEAHEVDLTGQAIRDSRGHEFVGGIGSQQDFIRGAAHSSHGRPIIVLTSTADSGKRSRIVAGLEPGSGVVTGRGDIHYVVTEFGIARMRGRSIRERVLSMVEIAHPDFRESLMEQAHSWGWIPKIFNVSPTSPGEISKGLQVRRVIVNGKNYQLRPLLPSDTRALQEFFYSHDEETVRLRYGHAKERMSSEAAYRMVAVDQNVDLALALFEEYDHRLEIRAVARFYRDSNGETAEVAFVVHEDLRRVGLARYLLREMAVIAQKRGIKRFWASVLKRNKPMGDLFVRAGANKESEFGEDSDDYWLDVDDLVAHREKSD